MKFNILYFTFQFTNIINTFMIPICNFVVPTYHTNTNKAQQIYLIEMDQKLHTLISLVSQQILIFFTLLMSFSNSELHLDKKQNCGLHAHFFMTIRHFQKWHFCFLNQIFPALTIKSTYKYPLNCCFIRNLSSLLDSALHSLIVWSIPCRCNSFNLSLQDRSSKHSVVCSTMIPESERSFDFMS